MIHFDFEEHIFQMDGNHHAGTWFISVDPRLLGKTSATSRRTVTSNKSQKVPPGKQGEFFGQVKELFKSVQIHLLFTPMFSDFIGPLQFLTSPSLVMSCLKAIYGMKTSQKKASSWHFGISAPTVLDDNQFFFFALLVTFCDWRTEDQPLQATWKLGMVGQSSTKRRIAWSFQSLICWSAKDVVFFILLYVNIVNSFWLWSQSLQQLQF